MAKWLIRLWVYTSISAPAKVEVAEYVFEVLLADVSAFVLWPQAYVQGMQDMCSSDSSSFDYESLDLISLAADSVSVASQCVRRSPTH